MLCCDPHAAFNMTNDKFETILSNSLGLLNILYRFGFVVLAQFQVLFSFLIFSGYVTVKEFVEL